MHRYALILAGGSGTRLWPMSRENLPKQLLPFIAGKSLLQLAYERLEGLVPPAHRYLGAGEKHRKAILAALPGLAPEQFLGEPMGRDTLNAIGLGTAILAARDPEAVIGVFTADQLIEPVAEFQRIVDQGYSVAEQSPKTLVTFGIAPTEPATGFGYLELGEPLAEHARIVRRFTEKPPRETAEQYVQAGPGRYLWNSGMFVWRAATLLQCIRRFRPNVFEGLQAIAHAWDSPRRSQVLSAVFPQLEKISVDFAVMEPASRDEEFRVAAVPMSLQWRDVGSWPSYAETCPCDPDGNALAAGQHLLLETKDCLVVSSDPKHLVAAIGCEDLIIIHTPDATLVCRKDQAEKIKELHREAGGRFAGRYL